MNYLFPVFAVTGFLYLAFLGRGYWAWVLASVVALFWWGTGGVDTVWLLVWALFLLGSAMVLLGVPRLRRSVISLPLMSLVAKAIPKVSETEDIALKAGTVWWDKELFSGNAHWQKLLDFKIRPLSVEEQAFLDGPTNTLCAMLDDWQISRDGDFGPEIWDYFKVHKFFGMIIPPEYSGLGFSAAAHGAVVARLASRSVAAAVTVMVPNSLGPGELLMHYGTDAQKKHYLPRLAQGLEIPCFALTEVKAGSDAGSGKSCGIVSHGQWQGREVLGITLTFAKRYITLAPVATIIGLAFHLHDPEHLLGEKEHLGITCALVPRDLPGIKIGRRHDPMGVSFANGPLSGKDVFIPLDNIIGGVENVGNGWRMLMETLATGRGISLPSLSAGAVEMTCRATSAYSMIREQFGLPIARFEGVKERLARIAAFAYLTEAVRKLTAGAVDSGERPSVITAIAKAYLTEGMRLIVNDGMDVFGGAAICRGPANIFALPYNSIPIGITVEGANILTRSLIVFGQGAVRCHPFLQKEIQAVANKDVKAFDQAFFGHLNYTTRNAVRTLLISLFGSLLTSSPVSGGLARHYHHLSRLNSAFALLADIGVVTMGGALKRKEYLSGRYADALAWLYLASAALKRFHDDGNRLQDRPLLDWVVAQALYNIENALSGILKNFPNRLVAGLLKGVIFPCGTRHHPPTDRQHDAVVVAVHDSGTKVREDLSKNVFIPGDTTPGLGAMEAALVAVNRASAARKKLNKARKDGMLVKGEVSEMAEEAGKIGIISNEERLLVLAAQELCNVVIQVDDFE